MLPTVLLTAAILGLPTVVYAWGRTSSSFTITHVRVTGTDLVPRRKVAGLLRNDYLGKNLFTVTSDDVRRTLAPLVYVSDAQVDRDFPDTLRVAIVEHDPALYVLASDGWFLVADDGFVVCPASVAPGTVATGDRTGSAGAGSSAPADGGTASATPSPDASPTHKASTGDGEGGGDVGNGQGADGSSSTAGKDASAEHSDGLTHVATPSAALRRGPSHAPLELPALQLDVPLQAGRQIALPAVRGVLGVMDVLSPRLRHELTVAQITAGSDITLRLRHDLTVRWGDDQRSLAKRLALDAVLRAYTAAGKSPSFIDVSVPDRVLARPILK